MFEKATAAWWRPGELRLQSSLFGFAEPAVDESFAGLRRIDLDDEAWVDHHPGWLVGDLVVFDRLVLELSGVSASSSCGSGCCPSRA